MSQDHISRTRELKIFEKFLTPKFRTYTPSRKPIRKSLTPKKDSKIVDFTNPSVARSFRGPQASRSGFRSAFRDGLLIPAILPAAGE